jgi:DNA-binding NarL/FixJ family response regulator
MKNRVLLLENQSILSAGLVSLIKNESSIELTQISMEDLELVSKNDISGYDLLVFGIDISCDENKPTLKLLKSLKVPKLMYTSVFSHKCFQNIVKHKINGYITLNESFSDFLEAVQLLQVQETFYSKDVINQLKLYSAIPKSNLRKKLDGKMKISKRELEIVRFIHKGFQSKQIGEALGISDRTVGKHRENIMKKCQVKNVTELLYFIQKNEFAV